jgi:hypothetical protein
MKRIAKLAIVGSRTFRDYRLLESIVLHHFDLSTLREIISGGAIGTDTLAAQFARTHHIPLTTLLPQWNLHGRAAGIIRNRHIVDAADAVIAFSIQDSPGTQSVINYCRKIKKHLTLIHLTEDGHAIQ